MPPPARTTRFGAANHATPSRGAKLSFVASHKGVPCGASVMVRRFSTPITVNGSVPLGEEGAPLYSHRKPYVIVSFLAGFHVSWANKLQFEITNWVFGVYAETTP